MACAKAALAEANTNSITRNENLAIESRSPAILVIRATPPQTGHSGSLDTALFCLNLFLRRTQRFVSAHYPKKGHDL
jgi:hypothetical protein